MAKKNHPYADLFPMMTEVELDALAEDIAENGQQHEIVLYQGKVLDGRNRLLACERAKVEPRFRDFDGDDSAALALVISLNVQRRDLTAGQRAIVAAKALPMFEEAGHQRKVDGAKKKDMNGQCRTSRDDASKVFKVGVNAVQQAKALLSDAPDLADQVSACTVSLAGAYEQRTACPSLLSATSYFRPVL